MIEKNINDEFDSQACINNSEIKKPFAANLVYAFIGMLFGIVFVKAEIVSWFRRIRAQLFRKKPIERDYA